MKKCKKLLCWALIVVILLQMLIITAYAVNITLTLSKTNGYAGDSITASGTSGAAEWITVKVLDGDGNIIHINAVQSGADGSYSDTFIVPDVSAGTLQVIAGYGSEVTSANFAVMTTPSGGGSSTDENSAIQAVSVTFDETAKAYLKNLAGSGDIVLDIEQVDITALSDEAQKRIGNRPVYQFSLTAGDTAVSVFGGGFAYISIPYTPAAGENNNKIVVYYLSDTHDLAVIPNALYDAASETVKFSTSHFSTYAVGYNDVTFSDVSETAWYYDAVTFIAAREITNGTGNNMFSPDANMTRAMLATILYRLSGDEGRYTNTFSDVASGMWYEQAVVWAAENGITMGVGNSCFSPENNITREQMLVFHYRYAQYAGLDVSVGEETNILSYNDALNISDYAYKAMQWAFGAGIINGDGNGYLNPGASATRAQIAKITAVFIQNTAEYETGKLK